MGKPSTKPKPAPKPTKAAVAKEPETSERSHSLDSLAASLGPPDAAFAARTFATSTEPAMVEQGTRIDSQSVLDDVPRFAASALTITAALTATQQRHLLLPTAIYPLLIHEARALQVKKSLHDDDNVGRAADKANRAITLRATVVAGIAERDAVHDALRNALGAPAAQELQAVVGRADTAELLAKGHEALAKLIDRKAKSTPDTAAALDDYKVGPTAATALRKSATKLRELGKVTATPGRRITQRALDLQDGRVLLLIEKILRAFRAARRADPTILLPELNKLARMFDTRGRAKAAKDGGGEAETETETEGEEETKGGKEKGKPAGGG